MIADRIKPNPGKIIFTILYLLFFPVILLWLSGDWFWTEGWIFGIWFIVMCVTVILYLYRNDPELLSERYKQPGEAGQKKWDRYVVYGLMIGFLTWIIIMPLDAKRYGWTGHFPLFLKIIGFILLLISFYLFYRSYADNSFVSPLVRIQNDRKQHVVTTGVYGFVRHPMYLAGILLFVGTPLLLGSSLGLVVGFLIIFLLAFRTLGEEKMLVEELNGYENYKKKVRYRFIPYIW
jgi:protein-S-isoprenylcysteine O-methyltransferase Ste14